MSRVSADSHQPSVAPFPIRVIPCLDIRGDRTVKGQSFTDIVDAGDPVSQAMQYDAQGADELCFLDIDATHENRETLYALVTRTAQELTIPLTVGGGVRSLQGIDKLLHAGADKVTLNSVTVSTPEFVAQASQTYGAQCIVASIDARWDSARGGWEVVTHGGRKSTGIDLLTHAQQLTDNGAGEILLTSIDADGQQQGYDLEMLKAVARVTTVPIVASGGAGCAAHFCEAAQIANVTGVLAASLFHFAQLSIAQVKQAMTEQNLVVRTVAP